MYVFTAHVALILINGYELARHRVMLARIIVHAALYICVDCFVFFSGNSRKDCAKVTFDQKLPQGVDGPGNQVFQNLVFLSGYSYRH